MKRLYLLVLLIAVAMCLYPAGKDVLNVQVGDSSGVAHLDSVRAVFIYGGTAYSGDSIDATYVVGDTIYGTYVDGTLLTLDSLLITDASGADSFQAYEDGDTMRITVDNPLKLTGTLIFTDFVFGSGTFGSAKTADTIENTAIAAGDYAFITWTNATDSVYMDGGGYHATILEDTIIVTTTFKETGTTYDYLVK